MTTEKISLRARRSTLLVFAAAALALAAPTVTHADGYTGNDNIAVSDGAAQPGQSITVYAEGFDPGSEVSVYLHSDPVLLGTATADSRGRIEAAFAVPAGTAIGTHAIEAVGVSGGSPLTLTINIAVSADGGDLPTTGMSFLPLVVTGCAVIIAGVVVLQFRRRRVA